MSFCFNYNQFVFLTKFHDLNDKLICPFWSLETLSLELLPIASKWDYLSLSS
jgi:hypothetical protein